MDNDRNNQNPRSAASFFRGAAAAMFVITLAAILGGFDFSTRDIINNSGGDAKGLARTMAVLGIAPTIEDAELAAIIESLRARAADGDTAAARFIAELAHLQRKSETPPDDPGTSADRAP